MFEGWQWLYLSPGTWACQALVSWRGVSPSPCSPTVNSIPGTRGPQISQRTVTQLRPLASVPPLATGQRPPQERAGGG